MKKFLFSLVAALSLGSVAHAAPILIAPGGVAPTQNFDGLGTTGDTTSASALGILFSEGGANANTAYTSTTGGTNSGDTYSFGTTAGATDRAFGGIRSGNLIPTVGLYYQNTSGAAINSLTIGYRGEQYRLGTAGRADRLDFGYLTSASGQDTLPTTGFTELDAGDFIAPVTTGTVRALDGNSEGLRNIGFTFNVNLANNEFIYFRFADADVTGADDGLAIDDFSLAANVAAVPEPSTIALFSLGLASLGAMRRRKKRDDDSSGEAELV